MFSLIYFTVVVLQCFGNHIGKEELKKHFDIKESHLRLVEEALLKLKKLAHHRAYGSREFGHDAAEDSTKPVSISAQQPAVAKEVSPYLFEGDIFLSQKQAINILKEVSSIESSPDKDRLRRSFDANPESKWPTTSPIKYRFHESLDLYAVSSIIKAVRYWENVTCLTFENDPDVTEPEDFIEFFRGQGCYSMIGRNGGRQGVSIGENCVKDGVIEHEIGHSLGLWHEQSRPDASSYVKLRRFASHTFLLKIYVVNDYILPSYASDFVQHDKDIITFGLPYDLGSVMHYGGTAFSIDQTSKTLVTRDPFYQSTIGQREKLSFLDVETINRAYCSDRCTGANTCKNGGYQHPNHCDNCLCPSGLAGAKCEEAEPPRNAICGGSISVTDNWQSIESPGYRDEGYDPDQKCSWLILAPEGKRIEFKFVGDFSFLCTSTCVDYVEMKISADLRKTGFRWCCSTAPKDSFVSETNKAIVIFRSQLTNDIGFKLQVRATDLPARTTPSSALATTTAVSTTVSGTNVWSEWGPWSQCSRTCGGCGIMSRVRTCRTKECIGRRQEFSTCNLMACPIDKHCAKLLSTDRLCNGRVCTNAAQIPSGCLQPQCCPPYINVDGMCQSDPTLFNDFTLNRK